MLDDYVKVIDGIKEEVLSFIDKFEYDLFILGKNLMRFKFKTDENLVYNKKSNIPVCVISVRSVRLQECFYENDYLDEKEK